MPAPADLSVVIVSYNTRQMTLECLRELYANRDGLAAEVWLVDNASHDGTPAAVREAFPHVNLIENDRNAGFGAANNQGMSRASAPFVLLLNTDAFVKPGAIAALVDYLKNHPDVGVVGPRLLNRDGSLQQSCFRFPSPLRCWMENLWVYAAIRNHPRISDYHHWPHDRERRVDFVIGACLMVRREVFEKVGGFDERFFMYSEETDWQWRMRQAGWAVAFTPAAQVVHLGGGSGAAGRINRQAFDSLDYYEWKHHGLLGLISVRCAMTLGCLLRAILWTGVLVALPARRDLARAKTRLHWWLCRRQVTTWRLPST